MECFDQASFCFENRAQDAPKARQDAPRCHKTPQNSSKIPPRRPEDAPRCAQDGSKRLQDAPRRTQGAARHPQDVPRRLQDAILVGLGSQSGTKLATQEPPKPIQTLILNNLGGDFGQSLVDVWRVWEGFGLFMSCFVFDRISNFGVKRNVATRGLDLASVVRLLLSPCFKPPSADRPRRVREA